MADSNKCSVTLYHIKSPHYWMETASFDEKGRLTLNRGDLDDNWYLHVTAGEIPALKRVLDKTCKPRANTGDTQADILTMLDTMFGGSNGAFNRIEALLLDRNIQFSKTSWIGSN